MFIINLCGFLFLCLSVSWYYKEKLTAVLPMGTGILLLALYILAFFQRLRFIDGLSICVIFFAIIMAVRKKDILFYFRDELCSPSSIIMFMIYSAVYICVKDKMIIDWDELGVWGLEVKSIFFVDGFADKYKFTAIGYADYFPGQMLFEWWTCHFSPKTFKEGLAYVGYYWMYVTFLMPVLGYLEIKKKYTFPAGIGIATLFLLIPGMTGTFGYKFLSAELLLSGAFASCLFQYVNLSEHNSAFSILNLTLSTMQLMLFKESGILYVIIAFLFGCLIIKMQKQRKRSVMGYKNIILASLAAGIPAAVWKIYCKIWERGKYFDNITSNLVQGVKNQNYILDENAGLYATSFFHALIKEPLHEDKTVFFDMPVVICVLLIIGLIYYVHKREYLEKKGYKTICGFYILSLVLSFATLLGMHIFIFREQQYLQTSHMIKSISRYLEPMFLGVIIFLFMFLISIEPVGTRQRINVIVCVSIILLCTNYKVAYDSIINYGVKNEAMEKERGEIISRREPFFHEMKKIKDGNYIRVLYIEPINDFRDERLFRYLAAPNSLILWQIDSNIDGFLDKIKYRVEIDHCDYVFFDGIDLRELGEDASYLEGKLVSVEVDGNGELIFDTID